MPPNDVLGMLILAYAGLGAMLIPLVLKPKRRGARNGMVAMAPRRRRAVVARVDNSRAVPRHPLSGVVLGD